ncbi:MAG TPA: sugar phosphate isomerase/epimerase [Chloroflexota bacterium]|nr:sugar phosphate isomerase/epimerase [Chloroflexota bacterium]
MKISYAHRRAAFYPFADERGPGNELPPKDVRRAYLRKVREIGFEAIEFGVRSAGNTEGEWKELRAELEGEGLKCAVIRGGGGVAHPRIGATYRKNWETAIRAAAALGAYLVNSAIGGGVQDPGGPGSKVGERTAQGSSRQARESDYAITADRFREVADLASDSGVEIAIEMHQNSIADNSWGAIHLLDLIDRRNVGVNPDLGNLYWNYAVPEESNEACIVALAQRAKYWHCKQLMRVHIPEMEKTYFLKVPLPDGEIDYRFAMAAMLEAGYQGYMAIEGCREGDQLYRDGKSVEYVKQILKELGR